MVRRRLDRQELIDQAVQLMKRAERLVVRIGQNRLRTSQRELLAASQAPNFWDDAAEAAECFDTFALGSRPSSPISNRLTKACSSAIRRAREARNEHQLGAAARAVEDAAREVQLCEARSQAGDPQGVDEASGGLRRRRERGSMSPGFASSPRCT